MSYKKIGKGETPAINLTPENIRQLEDAGFKWSTSTLRTFDERYAELMEYKDKFGHCNVPQMRTDEYQSLGEWCSALRTSYKKIQNRGAPRLKLTKEQIRKLEDAGLKWSLTSRRTFDEWYAELMTYKEKNGHCNAPTTKFGEYQSLGQWCSNVRSAYTKIRKTETPHHTLTEEHIKQLDDAGFKWRAT